MLPEGVVVPVGRRGLQRGEGCESAPESGSRRRDRGVDELLVRELVVRRGRLGDERADAGVTGPERGERVRQARDLALREDGDMGRVYRDILIRHLVLRQRLPHRREVGAAASRTRGVIQTPGREEAGRPCPVVQLQALYLRRAPLLVVHRKQLVENRLVQLAGHLLLKTIHGSIERDSGLGVQIFDVHLDFAALAVK